MRNLNLPPDAPEHREFTICRDRHGHWLAVEGHGLLGGVFISRKAAERFALDESNGGPEGVHIVAAPDVRKHRRARRLA